MPTKRTPRGKKRRKKRKAQKKQKVEKDKKEKEDSRVKFFLLCGSIYENELFLNIGIVMSKGPRRFEDVKWVRYS